MNFRLKMFNIFSLEIDYLDWTDPLQLLQLQSAAASFTDVYQRQWPDSEAPLVIISIKEFIVN